MTKKIITVFTILIIVSLLVLGGSYFYNLKKQTSDPSATTALQEFFPQGSIISNITDGIVDTITPGDSDTGFYNTPGQSNFNQGISLGFLNNASSSVITYIKPDNGKIIIYDNTEKKEIWSSNTTKVGLFSGQAKQTSTGYSFLVSHSPDNQTLENTAILVNTKTATSSTKEISINQNQQAVLSPDGNSIFYLREDSSGVTGFIKNLATNQDKQIFSSPLSSWLVAWPQKDTLILTTKPGKGIRGSAYTLSTTGILKQVLNNTDSLVTLASPDVKKIIYNKFDDSLSTYLYDIDKDTSYKLGVKTFVDKCTWANNIQIYCLAPRETLSDTSLEDWYKGKISFTDDLWTIDSDTKEAKKISTLPTKIDGYNLFVDSKEKLTSITNKLDGSMVFISIN